MDTTQLKKLATLIRYFILASTTAAGSGHPTSSLSATDLMATLMFGGFFKADLNNPSHPNNDRLIFSKGHAAPLFYSLYAAAGKVSEQDLLTLRQLGSKLEGHPTMDFAYTEAATGSLGQGLSVGLGMALNAKYLDKLPYKTFVLLGDSEMAEGSVWEAIQLAAHYKLDNLIGIIDVNRLGQRGETMLGHHVETYAKRVAAFGWKTIVVDGHDIKKIATAYKQALAVKGKPVMIIAKTIKGKGVKFLENKEGWHGKALNSQECEQAIKGLGQVDTKLVGAVTQPAAGKIKTIQAAGVKPPSYTLGEKVATRKAFGNALARLQPKFPNIVSLDAETSNSTMAETFKKMYPRNFFEMYIAEQNMVGAALGLSRRQKIPFVSTFTAFFTRAYDQIRMSQYCNANIKFVGSHAGVSIGEDGASQMGLEEIAMFRTLLNSVVLYPSDAMSTEKLVEAMAGHQGNVYMQTTRMDTPVIYDASEQFAIGGSKTLRSSAQDVVTVVAAGVTLFEALKAHESLAKEGVNIRVIDLYSIKPLDTAALKKAVQETKAIITVEDHCAQGGLGEAVASALSDTGTKIKILAVSKTPHSGKPSELLALEEIDSTAIIKAVKELK